MAEGPVKRKGEQAPREAAEQERERGVPGEAGRAAREGKPSGGERDREASDAREDEGCVETGCPAADDQHVVFVHGPSIGADVFRSQSLLPFLGRVCTLGSWKDGRPSSRHWMLSVRG